MQNFPQFTVVDSRLQAGRGEEFSASRQKEQQQLQQAHSSYDDVEPWHLPIGHRVEDSLDTDGIAMASTDTAIPDSNKGFQMLQKMGWKGTGLGRNENGIVEPVRGGVEAGLRLGVGKAEQESFYTAADNVVRKKLEVELQADENQERRDRREMQAERDLRIKQDVTHMQRVFYCQTCSKQYKNAAEMEAHLSSYDHHHKKRLIEMRNDEAERTRGIRDRKEKKRADKEMARLHAQIQAAQAAAAPSTAATNSMEATPQPPFSDSPPPLPPLPPEEEAHPPPPPPPPPADPPFIPTPPMAPGHCALRPGHASQQSRWQQPAHPSSQQSATMQHASSGSSQAPYYPVLSGHGCGPVSTVQVKSEAEPVAAFDSVPAAVKVEGVGTTGREAHLSSGQQPAKPVGGAIQFGFGGAGRPAGKTAAGMLRPLAKPSNRKPGGAVKPILAAFDPGCSDDD
ncbi:hypothetical protein ABBQ38_012575 [Trebouxia sp. C0009 RCD-2024]